MTDSEGEVRTTAVSKLSEFCKLIDLETIQKGILPEIDTIAADSVYFVKAALAENLFDICLQIGKELSDEKLMKIVN
jgi:hypothetical protein